jgi:hypothetical protein
MGILHISPSDTASGALRVAARGAGRDDDVLAFLDDLSCGPIDPLDAAVREAWWRQFSDRDGEAIFRAFWDRVMATQDDLVVWFSRHSASEFAFFLAWTDCLGDRPYRVIDVTGRRLPSPGRDGAVRLQPPRPSVSILQPDALRSLFGQERSPSPEERASSAQDWRRLQSENAPFRIATGKALVSTSVDHFDPWLLKQATTEWQSAQRLVAETDVLNAQPYDQVGYIMLRARLVALVAEGRLEADGDPQEISTRIRLPV